MLIMQNAIQRYAHYVCVGQCAQFTSDFVGMCSFDISLAADLCCVYLHCSEMAAFCFS